MARVELSSKEILTKVRELLSNEDNWVQNHAAVNINGKGCHGGSIEAVKWCILGAISKCSIMSDGLTSPNWSHAVNIIEDTIPGPAARFNDTHTHIDVLSMIDKAIANHA